MCKRPAHAPPPTLSTTSAVRPGVKRPGGILSLSSCRFRVKNKRSLIPIVQESGGFGGCKVIQLAPLIPPYSLAATSKTPPPSHNAAGPRLGPQCVHSKKENGAKKKLQQQSRMDIKTVVQKIGSALGRGWGRVGHGRFSGPSTHPLSPATHPPRSSPCCCCSFVGLPGNQNIPWVLCIYVPELNPKTGKEDGYLCRLHIGLPLPSQTGHKRREAIVSHYY